MHANENSMLVNYASVIQKYKEAMYIWNLELHNGQGNEERLIDIQKRYDISISRISGSNYNLFEYVRDEVLKLAIEQDNQVVRDLQSLQQRK